MKRDISIGEIVAMDFRAASVFKEAGIDFCCLGSQSIVRGRLADSCSS